MRKPTPKTIRAIKRRKRSIFMTPGVQVVETDVTYVGRGSRVNKLPRSYDEYNPKKVHVARRRKACKEFYRFPSGWTIEEARGESYISEDAIQAIARGGWVTATKESETEWSILGDITT